MEAIQIINTICDAIENVTISTRTRKTKENNEKQSDVFKFPNEAKTLWYKYEQITAHHRFDCDKLREATNGLELLCGGITSTAIIDSQKTGRALSVEAFAKMYNDPDGVTIDLFDALSKKAKEVQPETVKKQFNRLSNEQQRKLVAEQAKALGLSMDDLTKLAQAE